MDLRTVIPSVVLREDDVLFYERFSNGLWKCDKRLLRAELVRFATKDISVDGFSALDSYYYNEDVFICSQTGRDVIKYSEYGEYFSKYTYYKHDEDRTDMLFNYALYDKYIYQFPTLLSQHVTRFNMETQTYEQLDPLVYESMDSKTVFANSNGKYVFIPEFGTNRVYKYDMENNTSSTIMFDEALRIESVCGSDDLLYAMSVDQPQLYIKSRNQEKSISLDDCYGRELCGRLIEIAGYCVALPRWGDYLYVYDRNTEIIKQFNIQRKKSEVCGKGSFFYGYYIDEKKLYLLPWQRACVYEYDVCDNELREHNIGIGINKHLPGFQDYMEEGEFNLIDFIQMSI